MPAPTPHCLPRLSPSGRLHNSAPSHLEAQWTPAPPSSCRAVRAPHMAASRGVLRAAPRAHAPAGAPAVHCLLTSTPGSGSFARLEQISGLRTGHSFNGGRRRARLSAPTREVRRRAAATTRAVPHLHPRTSRSATGGAGCPDIAGHARRPQEQTPGAEARFAHRDHASAPGDALYRHYGRRCARQLDSSSAS